MHERMDLFDLESGTSLSYSFILFLSRGLTFCETSGESSPIEIVATSSGSTVSLLVAEFLCKKCDNAELLL